MRTRRNGPPSSPPTRPRSRRRPAGSIRAICGTWSGGWSDAIDGDGGAGNDNDEYDKNRFHASPLAGRVRLDGSLDKEAGEIVMTALDAMQAKLRQDGDTRPRSAKQADALDRDLPPIIGP